MKTEEQLMFALGMAQKAGKAPSGDYAVKAAISSGKTRLLVLAADASDNSKKELYSLAKQQNIRVLETLDRQRIGWAVGKAQRTAVAIIDKNIVKMFED